MIKLIVTDLDGSLLNEALNVPTRFFSLVDKIFSKNIHLAIATGRAQASIREKFEPIIDQLYSISDNGSLLKFGTRELLCTPIEQKYLNPLVEIGRSIDDAWPVFCGKERWFIENTDTAFLDKVHLYTRNYEVVEDLNSVNEPIIKISLCDLKGAEFNSNNHYQQYANDLKIAVGGSLWLDITMQNANKGYAVEHLQNTLGVTKEETLVFGDMLNDIEMMSKATYSYAMKNAHPLLKEVASFITDKDNNEEGVLDMIEKLCF